MTTENSKPPRAFLTHSQFMDLSNVAHFLSQFIEMVDEYQELELKATEITSVILPLSNKLEDVLVAISEQHQQEQLEEAA